MDRKVKEARTSSRFNARSLVGWTVSALCLALIAWKVDLAGAWAAMRQFSWPLIFLSLAGLAFGYLMRIARWAVMLRAGGAPVRIVKCAVPFLGSIALNNVLPLRAGDIVRATVFPAAIGVPRSTAFGSIVMERLLDLLTLVLFLAIGSSVLAGGQLPRWLVDSAITLALVGVTSLIAIIVFSGFFERLALRIRRKQHQSGLTDRMLRIIVALLASFRHMAAPRALATIILLSLCVWLGEAATFYAVMIGFGIEQPPIVSLLVMSFITLSTLVPSSPGYVGPFHLAAFSVMVLLGVSEEVATSFAVLSHLMLWVPTTLAGGIAMLVHPEIFRAAKPAELRAANERDNHEFPTV